MWLLNVDTDGIKNPFFIDLSQFNPEELRDLVRRKDAWKKINDKDAFTKADFYNIWNLTDKEAIDAINLELNIDITTAEWINTISELLSKSIEYYEHRYKRKVWRKIASTSIKSTDDILTFIRGANTNWPRWIINCAIMNTATAVHDSLNPAVLDLEAKTEYVIDKYLAKPLQLIKITDYWYEGTVRINWTQIPFDLIYRWKEKDSIVSKVKRDPNYYASDLVKDWIWLTFKVDKPGHAILLQELISQSIFGAQDYDVSWKELFSKALISAHESKGTLEPSFLEKVKKSLDDTKADGTSSWYIDSKSKWRIPIPRDIKMHDSTEVFTWIEAKVMLKENKNEKWINMQWVYGHFRIFEEWCRDHFYVGENYIKYMVNDFFETLPTILKENRGSKNKDPDKFKEELWESLKGLPEKKENETEPEKFITSKWEMKEKELAQWLVKYYKSRLVPAKIGKHKKIVYISKRNARISQEWYMPPVKKQNLNHLSS